MPETALEIMKSGIKSAKNVVRSFFLPYEFRFRCDVTTSNDEGEKRKESLVLRRILFLQGGYTYMVTPLLKAGHTSCKV